MIPASRQDRKRLAKLGGAVLAVLAFAAWRVTGSILDTTASGPRRVVAIGGDRPEVAVLAASGQAAKLTLPDQDVASDASIDPDPFRPLQVAAAPPTIPATKRPMPAPITGSLAPDVAAAPLKIIPSGALPKAPLSMRLTGVVVGAHPTAVVMVGDDEIVVRPGSRLPDGSTLVQIDAASATLARKGQTFVLWVAD